MKNLLSGLAIAATLALSGTALAQTATSQQVPGYYRFDLMHFVILNGSGTTLSDVQRRRVEEIFEKCDVAPDYDSVRGPLSADERNAQIDTFRRCVNSAMFDARWRDHVFSDYLLLEGTLNGRPGDTQR